MSKPLITAAVMFLVTTITGCAGQLKVFDAQQNEIAGVPFRIAQVFVKTGARTKHSKGGECTPINFVETLPLPTGPLYYATAKSAQLAKTAFHIKFGETGTVSEIGMDSEPAGAESFKAISDLLKTVLPALGIAAAGGLAAGGGKPPIAPACDAGEDSVKFISFDEYIKR